MDMDLIDLQIEANRDVTGAHFRITEKSPFRSYVVVMPFEGRKKQHMAGVFYDFTLAPETVCGLPTKAMSRESAEVVFDHRKGCRECAKTTTG